jgi:hypothetical protein
MAEEYWHPTQNWNLFEYFGAEMTVLRKVTDFEPKYGWAGIMLFEDTGIFRKRWPAATGIEQINK